ncbi:MAG: S-layer family protein [Scytonematopsis contorta HA4267-MV1]|jgi:filamentous hemagglutinin family protein|nr:S-layer family protein [Scytonematopsis contorta HA4267-MV1]
MNYSLKKHFYLKFLTCIAVSSLIHSYINPAVAQITPDATLPINTNIRVNNNTSILEAGTRVQGNLFHSLREFSVINGSEAFFNNPLDIRNIITRVTGQSISNIDGIIRANGSANLFFINPNGIIFGQNARLDIGGSFVGTTANSLLFNNGWEYSATNPNVPPLLTVNVPVGLQFGRNPGAIEVRGSGHELAYDTQNGTTIQDNVPALGVRTGKTFALVGGDIFIKGGNLNAESGKIFLGSVISPDFVEVRVNDSDLAFRYLGLEKFGNIELSQKASVDVSGERGGSIQIQSQGLSIKDDSSVLSITTGSQPGRDIVVNTTKLVELIGESTLFTESQGAGSSGNIIINTQKLTATSGSFISTYTNSSGNAGQITVTAPQAIEFSETGTEVAIFVLSGLYTGSSPFSSGSAGNINIKTGRLSVKVGGGVLSRTDGEGNAGEVTINATSGVEVISVEDLFFLSAVGTISGGKGNAGNLTINTPLLQVLNRGSITTSTQGAGRGGDLTINTGELILRDRGTITATAAIGEGDGGNITVNATSGVEINGSVPEGGSVIPYSFLSTSSFSSTGNAGNAGNLTINTPLLRVLNAAGVSVRTFGAGRGGDLTINTGELIVRDGGIINASTLAEGQGGNITINAISLVELIGVNAINKSPSGLFAGQYKPGEEAKGNAGNVIINTPLLRVLNGAAINADTLGAGRGGELKITTDQLLVRNASIRALSIGTGSAGNLTINAKNAINLDDNALLTANTRSNGLDQAIININSPDLILRRGSRITTNATGSDVIGGDINIKAGNLALLERSNITANSTDARGGKINIQAQGLFQSPDSAITARGRTQALSGTVNINTTLDPSSVLKEIPINLVDPSGQIASSCVPGTAQNRNYFTITGRGGIPANSTELLQDTSTIAAWVTKKPKPESEQPSTIPSSQQSSAQPNPIPQPIVEATDWLVDNRGQIHLVAINKANHIPSKPNLCPN